MTATNTLFYGDNLNILHDYVADKSVDLVYLDPPFNSNATYNLLFKAPTGEQSQSQIEAFGDTWHWTTDGAECAFDEVVTSGNTDAAEMLRAMRSFLGENDMMAYLAMMAVRLIEHGRTTEKAIVSVKGGINVGVAMVKELIATIEHEKAKIGIFITLADPTTRMLTEAATAGFYESPMHGKFARVQILTVEDLFNTKQPHMPWIDPSVFKKAKREKTRTQVELDV